MEDLRVGDRVKIASLDFEGVGDIPNGCLGKHGVVIYATAARVLVVMDQDILRPKWGFVEKYGEFWSFPPDCVSKKDVEGKWWNRKDLPKNKHESL